MPSTDTASDVATVDPTVALPVLLRVSGTIQDGVRGWVEGVLGWQTVDPNDDVLVPPRLCLADPAAVQVERAGPRADVPTIMLVGEHEDPAGVASAALRLQPVATLCWPRDRDRLEAAALGGLRATPAAASGAHTLRVGGAAGGVGTSTVAAALAGLSAWQGMATLLIVGPGAPLVGVRGLAPEALAGTGLWSQASPVPGVRNARAVQLPGRDAGWPAVADPAVTACVVDAGIDDDVDVLVCRADAAGLAAAGRTTAAAVVVIGSGPAPRTAVQQACGPRRRVHLPRSARVARAGLQARVPAGLPGSWLRPLSPLVQRGTGPP